MGCNIQVKGRRKCGFDSEASIFDFPTTEVKKSKQVTPVRIKNNEDEESIIRELGMEFALLREKRRLKRCEEKQRRHMQN